MKKIIVSIMILACAIGNLGARFCSINSLELMQQCKDGKELMAELEKERDNALNVLKKLDAEIGTLEETLQKQVVLLKKEELLERQQVIASKRKARDRKVQEIDEEMRGKFGVKQNTLYIKCKETSEEVFKRIDKDCSGLLIDTAHPAVVMVGEKTSIMKDVLSSLDVKYEKSKKEKTKRETKRA